MTTVLKRPLPGVKTPHIPDVVDAVDASHVLQGLMGHHPRRVRRLRPVVWVFWYWLAKIRREHSAKTAETGFCLFWRYRCEGYLKFLVWRWIPRTQNPVILDLYTQAGLLDYRSSTMPISPSILATRAALLLFTVLASIPRILKSLSSFSCSGCSRVSSRSCAPFAALSDG